jgi:hypothetical protein
MNTVHAYVGTWFNEEGTLYQLLTSYV